ncbi:MAG TPA: RodZ domain-containing protein [Rhodocyclaceae bacterium]|jgi:cytoskeleton protein RodZ
MSEDLQAADLLQVEATPEPVEPVPVVMPGFRLKAERESQGHSIAEVSHALKFGIRQIEALEADNYDLLQGSTFLRGFIRSYARYLKLDDAPLLALLTVAAPPAQAEIVAPTNMGEAMTQPFIDRNQKWLMLGMALVVVLAVGAYWLTMNEKLANSNDTELSASKDKEDAAVAPQPTVVAPTPVAITPTAVPAQPPVPTPAPATPPAAPTAPVSAPVAPATPAAVKPISSEKPITLDFEGRSWVEIKDANQRIVFTGEYNAGTHQVATGKPPFQLWVGKVSAVRITYNEQKVNLQPFARDEVARLTLD